MCDKKSFQSAGQRWLLPLLLLVGMILPLAACDANETASTATQTDDVTRPIADQLQNAFNVLPDGIANQDFGEFERYFATAEQGADEDGINEIYTWIQELRAAGIAPAETSEYKLNEFHVTNIKASGSDATAHISLTMSKIADGNNADAALAVEQDIALVQVNGQWLISGADKAQITDQTKAPQ